MLLNMATSRKIWCRINNSTDPINEPILVEYDETDTVDDFKTKIFNKLNATRFKAENDNASIVIGFYQMKNNNNNNSNNSGNSNITETNNNTLNKLTTGRSNSRGLPRVESFNASQLDLPVFINSRNNNNNTSNKNNSNNNSGSREELNMTPVSDRPNTSSRLGLNDISANNVPLYDNSEDTTPQRLSTSSPKLALSSRINIPPKYGFHPLASSYGGNKNSAMFLPPLTIPYNSPTATTTIISNSAPNAAMINLAHSPSYVVNPSLSKPLDYTVQEVDDNMYRITFNPDQLLSEIYLELFGSLGQQSASEPLLIFSNKDLSLGNRNDVSMLSTEKHLTSNANARLNNKESSTMQVEIKDDQLFENNTPTKLFDDNILRPVPKNISPSTFNNRLRYSNDDINNFKEGEFTDENNNDINLDDGDDVGSDVNQQNHNEEDSEEYPRQGVLLLPKGGYNKDDGNDWARSGYEDEILKGDDGNESLLYNDRDSKPHFKPIDVSPLSPSSNSNSNNLVNAEEQEPIVAHTNRALSEQEVGPSIIETELRSPVANDSFPTQPMLLNIPNNNSNENTANDSLGKILNISNIPTPLSTTFPMALKMIKNETIGVDNPDKNNVNTSEKVFPKINVLIVEDNVINQAILGSFLRKHKISYKIAKNGKEAVDKWKEGGLHLIFMDLQLPVLSGIEAAKQIRDCEKKKTKTNNAPVIIVALTASNSIDDKRKALISGCNDYLTKPVNLHWLSKKITEWGCMQALIDFDSWKQGQRRMTENVIIKSPHKTKVKDN